ncbi:RING-H2 finger protein ATL67-like [Chenopodium quinoa]|uniref:RING-H2 finger protein ATL67-like n=1 Tax=Chenopodium quinoa TaxID=63459 RepID=UPI000B799935|nr:RING-H2 finger protein ATL67-like [Chenopodium quinoa]
MSAIIPPPSSSPPHSPLSLQNLGLGYAIAIAFGFLVLFSALLLSSYICCRANHRRRRRLHAPPLPNSSDNGIIVPRIIFVAEDDNDDEENQNRASNGVVGLDRAVINSYPKFQFYKKNLESSNGDNLMCSICLCDYKEGEMLRMMPDCNHFFHLCCLDAWLKLNGSCPVCRNSPLPTPISTPLAEVVPLSQYPDNRRRSTVISSS